MLAYPTDVWTLTSLVLFATTWFVSLVRLLR